MSQPTPDLSQHTPDDEEDVDDSPAAEEEAVVSNKKFGKPSYKQRIFVVHGTSETLSEQDLVFTSLPHPKRGCQARYALTKGRILEIQRLIEEPASWFVGDSVQSDGSLYLATPVDPMFLMIPLLEASRKKTDSHAGVFCALDQVFPDTAHTGFAHLHTIAKDASEQLSLLCDLNDKMDEPFYRLNDDKVLRWLRCKVDRLATRLGALDNTSAVLGGAQSSTFRESSKKAKVSTEELQRAAIGFLSEYVDPKRIEALASSYGFDNFGPKKLSALDDLTYKSERGKRGSDDPLAKKEPEPKVTILL
eukprot:TRINITY_DN4589_c0_g1_i1.p1 TRINITY_DN4589_c0_g1~~TRINITY_DN4589_c0_g1_i1.p1  ORF type:complete len:305 (+),score=68.22 TRINITY_DN4589_c0_g1_i1:50-964(+)